MSVSGISTGVVYHVRSKDPAAHLFEVSCRIESPAADGQLLSLSSWIPGSYLVRDYARHVVAISAVSRGEPAQVRKLDKSTWRISPVSGPLLVQLLVYAADTSVRGAWLDRRGGFFNGTCLLPRVHGSDEQPLVVHIDPPDGPLADDWQLATSLRRLTGAILDFGAFQADDYMDLIDHPVLMGPLQHVEFEAGGTPHHLVIHGRHSADTERLRANLSRLCEWHVKLFGGSAPMDRYWFLLRTQAGGYGGLEHCFSSALVCHGDDLPRTGDPASGRGYRRFLGLVSHEYFHTWHVKRIRPLEFIKPDLSREVYTRQLWVFEGITSYYDDLALVRSGLISLDSYLELLGSNLTRLYRMPGRRRQSLEEASFDAWIKFYQPNENSPNATVSYYLKGALVALALDLTIRLKTSGRCTLDHVMYALWLEYGSETARHGLPEGAFEALAAETSGIDLDDFFRQSVRGTVDPPLGILLAQFGIRLHLRAAESAADAGGSPGSREQRAVPWLGITAKPSAGHMQVASIADDGPGQHAGVSAGDELVALDGRRVTAENYAALLATLPVNVDIPVHVMRDDELLALSLRPVTGPKDTCFLTLDQADAEAVARRGAWLSPPSDA